MIRRTLLKLTSNKEKEAYPLHRPPEMALGKVLRNQMQAHGENDERNGSVRYCT